MSTELNSLESNANNDVNVTAFFGGDARGRCMQLTQTRSTNELGYGYSQVDQSHYVQLDHAQVVELAKRCTDWLALNY